MTTLWATKIDDVTMDDGQIIKGSLVNVDDEPYNPRITTGKLRFDDRYINIILKHDIDQPVKSAQEFSNKNLVHNIFKNPINDQLFPNEI